MDDLVSDLESTDYEVVKAARQALADLGAEAGPAIPRLAEMLKTDRTCNRAAYALATIGTSSLPVLRDALTNGSAAARLEVALAIGTLREAAEDAVPGLVECMKYDDPEVRLNAIASLQMIAKGPVIAVPGLIGCLADSDARVRRSATIVLEKYGQVEADTTIPMLLRTAGQGENPLVRMRAAEILRAIAPERARAEGL